MKTTTNGPKYELIDPALGLPFQTAQMSTVEDVDVAVRAAAKASTAWARTDWTTRASILEAAATRIRNDEGFLASLLTQEQGKTLKEGAIEVRRCADTFDYYAADRFADRVTSRNLPGKHAWTMDMPLGVVAAIVPWNFPLTLLANKLVPALAAGNAVVVKPALTTPLATQRLIEHIYEAGLPEDVVTMVVGEVEVGEALVTHPDVPMVSFTGSTQTGRSIMRSASGRVKRLALELGGSDALLVDADVDIAGAAKASAVGRFFNCGQACVAVKRVFVHNAVADEFINAMAARVDRLVVGDGRTPGVMVGPQHTASQRAATQSLIDDAVARGARILRGGGVPDDSALEAGFFLEPSLLVDVPEDSRVLLEEVFGPVLPIVRVSSWEEAIQRANSSEFGLGSSIWSNNDDHLRAGVTQLQTGYTWVNDASTDYDPLPFGGMKQSGFGKERGDGSIEEFRVVKSVVSTEDWTL